MTDHSPTPWRIVQTTPNIIVIYDANNDVVTYFTDGAKRGRADAEAIVRYVNSCAENNDEQTPPETTR